MINNHMEEELLKKIGLTGNETKIYLALLKQGPCLVSKIVNETKLNRTHIYDRLQKLLNKGLISYVIKSGKKYFNAVSPDKLLQILDEKENEIEERRKEIIKILPELKRIIKKEEVFIEILQGKEGLKTLLQDALDEKKEIFILGFTGSVAKNVEYFYPHYQRKRIKLKIKRKILADSDIDKGILNQPLTKFKFLSEKYKSPSGTWLYGDKTVIFLPNEELYMIFIKSKSITKQYKNYFELIWNRTN